MDNKEILQSLENLKVRVLDIGRSLWHFKVGGRKKIARKNR